MNFNVYYTDGSHREFTAKDIVSLLNYLVNYDHHNTMISSITTREGSDGRKK